MSKGRFNRALIVLAIVAILVAEVSYFSYCATTYTRDMQRIKDSGAEACMVGVEASANPYKGSTCRKAWLDGWIEAKKRESK